MPASRWHSFLRIWGFNRQYWGDNRQLDFIRQTGTDISHSQALISQSKLYNPLLSLSPH